MAPPHATLKSVFPAAATPTGPGGGSFGAPGIVEFPMVTESEDADMTSFGSQVQADRDQDLNVLDARVRHVRDAQYAPGLDLPDASGVHSVTMPVAGRHESSWGKSRGSPGCQCCRSCGNRPSGPLTSRVSIDVKPARYREEDPSVRQEGAVSDHP